MASARLRELLERSSVPYQTLSHPTSIDAQRTADRLHVRGDEVAKTVGVRVDGRLCLVVLPASDHVDLERLRQGLGAREVELADPDELREAFPDCEVGAMPPFGSLYGVEVFVSPRLREDERITFKAGSHEEAICMRYGDYGRLAAPTVVRC